MFWYSYLEFFLALFRIQISCLLGSVYIKTDKIRCIHGVNKKYRDLKIRATVLSC